MSEPAPFYLRLGDSTRAHSLSGGLGIFAPTHAGIRHPDNSVEDLQWRARAHRKRRYRKLDRKGRRTHGDDSAWAKVGNLGNLEWKELSWWVAMLFTFGSIVWVINGFLVFLPQVNPEKYSLDDVGSGWTAWLGATIFEFGGLTALFEAMNRDDSIDFGEEKARDLSPDHEERVLNDPEDKPMEDKGRSKPRRKFIFFPSNPQLWREIGFVASFVQVWAASIFWISGWTGTPEILTPIKSQSTKLEDGVYWTPQVIGGSGFVLASLLYMLESQRKWWKIAPFSLGWQVGFWNLIGALGFTLCGIFGYSRFIAADGSNNWATYQSALSTFWGGWAFLIGSVIQWWEAVQPADGDASEGSYEEEDLEKNEANKTVENQSRIEKDATNKAAYARDLNKR